MDEYNDMMTDAPEKIVDILWICSEKSEDLFLNYRTEGSFIIDEQGVLTFATEEWLCFRGKKLMDSKDLRWLLFVYPPDRIRLYQSLFNAIENDHPFALAFRVYHPEKGIIWFLAQMEKVNVNTQKTERYLLRLEAVSTIEEQYSGKYLVGLN